LTSSSSNPVNPVKYSIWHSIPLRAALIIFLGLAAAQIIASLHVGFSNLEVYEKMRVLREASYLIVPNAYVLPSLTEWKSAILGGLFFTLSVGVFLTLLSLGAAWLRHRVLPRRKAVLLVFLLPWLALLIALNMRGFSRMPTLYALIIPPLVYLAASKCLFLQPHQAHKNALPSPVRPLTLFHLLSPLLLALLWVTQMKGPYFGDVRDYLLLSNSAGTKVSDFYYRYTLYPAEAFKSLDQKLIRAVFLKSTQNVAVGQALERELLKHDYLTVSKEDVSELVITVRDHELRLEKGGVSVSSVKLQEFLPSPAQWLTDFSVKTDRHGFFRKLTFISLLVGFPLFLYLSLYGLLLLPLSLFFSPRTASVVATFLCLLAGILLLMLLFTGREAIHDEGQVAGALQSANSKTKVAALKFIYDKELDIARYPAYRDLLKSSSIPERCWAAKALGASRRGESFRDLLSFKDDPHPTVVSASFQALAKRKNPAAIPSLLASIETSMDWYNQWNAYKALRTLGWKQSKSN